MKYAQKPGITICWGLLDFICERFCRGCHGRDDRRAVEEVFLPFCCPPVVYLGRGFRGLLDGMEGFQQGGCKFGVVRVLAVHGGGMYGGIGLRRGGGVAGIAA